MHHGGGGHRGSRGGGDDVGHVAAVAAKVERPRAGDVLPALDGEPVLEVQAEGVVLKVAVVPLANVGAVAVLLGRRAHVHVGAVFVYPDLNIATHQIFSL